MVSNALLRADCHQQAKTCHQGHYRCSTGTHQRQRHTHHGQQSGDHSHINKDVDKKGERQAASEHASVAGFCIQPNPKAAQQYQQIQRKPTAS